MGSKLDDALPIGLLVASIYIHELQPFVVEIKTLSDNDFDRPSVSARLIEEVKNLNNGKSTRAHAPTQVCGMCGKSNHSTDRYFFNPRNLRNKVNFK